MVALAAVAETRPDADGYWLRQLRDWVGPGVPIICTVDAHANVSQAMIDAAEAHRIGLVNSVVPSGVSVVDTARSVLQAMIANAPLALAECIAVVNRGVEISLDEALALEASAFGQLTGTDDAREGTSAFLEKRAPAFRGS